MAKVVDPKTYAKNVIRSAGYIGSQTIKGINPTLTSYITDGTNSAKEMYRSVKDFKSTVRNKVNSVLGETGFDDIKRIKGYALDDIRTGKFYNKERKEEAIGSMMESMGLSFNFDDLNFDVDEDFDEKSTGASDKVVMTMAEKIAQTQKGSSAASATKIAKGARANTAAMMAFNEKMFGQVNNSLAAINSSILNLHQDLATPLNTHIINSTNFYQTATNELAKQTSLLENMNRMLSDRFEPKKNAFGKKPTAYEQVFGNGLPSFKTWGKIAKSRIIESTGLDMLGGMLSPDMIKMLLNSDDAASPISTIATMLLANRLQNKPIGKALNRTVGTLQGGFTQVAARISAYAKKNKNKDTLPAILARLLDIAPKSDPKLNFANYNKGRADWTGQDSRALQVVIPTQLAGILAALTGQDAKIYDYKAGRFVTAKSAMAKFKKERTAATGVASSNLRSEILRDFIDEDKRDPRNQGKPEYTMNSRAVRNLSKDYDTLMSLLSMNNVDMGQFKKYGDLTRYCMRMGWVNTASGTARSTKPYFIDKVNIMRIDKMIFKRAGGSGRLTNAVYSGRIADNNFMNNAGDGTMASFAGSGIGNAGNAKTSIPGQLLNTLDDHGNNVFFYLQDYYKQLRIIASRSGVDGADVNVPSNTRGWNASGSFEVPNNNREARTRRNPSRRTSASSAEAAADPQGRDQWNSATGRYESGTPRASSRGTRNQEEKTSPISRAIDKVNGLLDKLFFGNLGESLKIKINEHGGLIGFIKDLPHTISEAVSIGINKAKEFANEKWQKFKNSEWGQNFFGSLKSSVTKFAKGTLSYASNKASNFYSWATGGKVAPWSAEVNGAPTTGAARGGLVTKTGMAAVSEGEYIIPNDDSMLASNKFAEKKAYSRWKRQNRSNEDFYGFYARGGYVNDDGSRLGYRRINNEDRRKARQMLNDGVSVQEIIRFFGDKAGSVLNFLGISARRTVDQARETKTGRKVSDVVNKVTDTAQKAIVHLLGDPSKYDNVKGNIKEAYRAAKIDMPKTVAKGAIGALIGAAATGSGLGLLGGFAIGAGQQILQNSEYLSKKLFGEEYFDDKGQKQWKDGKLPPKLTKFLKEKVPGMAKGGALGGILGAAMIGSGGGLLGGLVLGAGLELVSTTGKFKDIMFGPEDVNGKRKGGIMGSIKTHVVDPLIEFTKGGLTKIGEYVKENFLKPLKTLGSSLKDYIKGKTKSIINSVTDKIKEKVKSTVGQRVNRILKPVAEKVGAIGKFGLKAAGKIASAPFRFLGNTVGGAIEQHNVQRGFSSKNAAERMAMEGASTKGLVGLIGKGIRKVPIDAFKNSKIGTVKNNMYTKWAANATDEQIANANHYLNGANSYKREIIKSRQGLYNTLTSSLENGGLDDPAELKKIKKMFNTDAVIKDNDFSEIEQYVDSTSLMGDATKEQVKKLIADRKAEIGSLQDKRKNFAANRDEFFSNLTVDGKKLSEKELKNFIKTGRVQSDFDIGGIRKANGSAIDATLAAARERDNAAALLREQEQASPIDAERNTILKRLERLVGGIVNHLGVNKSDIPEASDSNPRTAADLVDTALPTRTNNPTNFENSDDPLEGRITTEIVDGDPVQFIHRNGETIPNRSDARTEEHYDRVNEEREEKKKFFGAFTSGGLLASLKGLFGGGKEEGSEKKTLLDKLKDYLGSENSIFGKIFGALGGSAGVAGLLKVAASGLVTAGVLSKIGSNAAGTSTDSGMYKGADAEARKEEVQSWTGVKGFFKKASLGADSIENRIRGRDTTTYEADDYVTEYESSRYKKRALLNAALSFNPKLAKAGAKVVNKTIGKVPIIGKGLAAPLNIGNNFGKAATKVTGFVKGIPNKLLDIATDPTKNGKLSQKLAEKLYTSGGKIATAAKSAGTKILSKVTSTSAGAKVVEASTKVVSKLKSVLSKVIEAISSKLGVKAATNSIDDVVENGARAMAKAGGKGLATALSKAVLVLQIAIIANAITVGFQKAGAKRILGILEEPTIGQRCLAAAINGVNYAIPGIGGLIPSETIFSIIYTVLNALGCDLGKLPEQRAAAKAEVEDYNKTNGTTYNIEEYLANVKDEMTIQDRIKQTLKGGRKNKKNNKGDLASQVNLDTDDDTSNASKTGSGSNAVSDSKVKENEKLLNSSSSDVKTITAGGKSALTNAKNKKGKYYSKELSASGSDGIHTTQKGNYNSFGGTTIDQNGCGPAVASTVLKAYGKNVGINSAANYATSNGYVAGASGVGTKASYFNDILGNNGINTSYTNTSTGIRKAVASGSPTILLGQDKSNKSKANSPFGPNPHYVVARGTDSNGRIVVDDPELRTTTSYRKDILNNVKLGVATGKGSMAAGESGISSFSDLIGNTIDTAFTKLTEKVGADTKAGKILGFIFGKNKSSEGSDDSSSSSSSISSSSGYSYGGTSGYTTEYGKNSIFDILQHMPTQNDKFIKYYNNAKARRAGISKCISGTPTDNVCNVLANCVGWACARFNHIYSLLTGYNGMKYPDFCCNAENFIEVAKNYGLTVSQSPQVGAIMVWKQGHSLGSSDGTGHVAIVERIDSETEVYTSESSTGVKFVNKTRKKGSTGTWGAATGMTFRGFIYNPAVSNLIMSQAGSGGNSPLVAYTKISPNKTVNRNHAIDTITIHCTAGQGTAEAIGNIFANSSRKASSNYAVDKDGRVGMYVEEKDRSWCTSSSDNDNRAVTIEVSSEPSGECKVNDIAFEATIRLVADICIRNGIGKLLWKGKKELTVDSNGNYVGRVDQQNMTVHRWFANKACPGDYLYNRMGEIAERANKMIAARSVPGITYGSSTSSSYGSTTTISGANDKEKIWNFLKQDGFSTNAACGMMGNWERESGNKANTVEGRYLSNYPGDSTVMASPQSMEDYTKNVLFPAYEKSNLKINKDAYLGTGKYSGYHMPGLGLAQWTGPRAADLINYGETKGKDWRKIETQLEFLRDEMVGTEKGRSLKEKMNKASSPAMAARYFYNCFERGRALSSADESSTESTTRENNASNILRTFNATGAGSGLLRAAMNQDPRSITSYTGVTKHDFSIGDQDIYNYINNSNNKQAAYSEMLNKYSPDHPDQNYSAMGSGLKRTAPSAFKNQYSGGSSGVKRSVANYQRLSGGASTGYQSQLENLVLYTKQIATNTANNASMPVLVDVMNQAITLLGNIAGGAATSNKTSGQTQDFEKSIDSQINLMKNKLESISQRL